MPSVKMNALWLQSVPVPESGQVDYFDTDPNGPGLGLRVGKTGRTTWFVMFRVKNDRTRFRKTLSKYPGMSLSEARIEARAVVAAADRGINPAKEKQIERKAPTFGELASEYLVKHAVQKKSRSEDERIIKKDLLPKWKRIKAQEIKRRDVIRLLDSIVDRGAPIQANRTLALVRKIFNWGVSRDIVEANPCIQVKAPGKEKQRDRVLSNDEIRAIWEAFTGLDPLVAATFKLRLITAQRGGEVQSMSWQDLDLGQGWWTIPSEFTKNELSHRVPLSEMAMKVIMEIKALANERIEKAVQGGRGGRAKKVANAQKTLKKMEEGWLFPSPTFKCSYINNVQKAAANLKDLSGVSDFILHDMRRTAASLMTGMGISRLVVGKILNHVEPGVTKVYDRHSYDLEKRDALDKWAVKLEQILAGEKAEVVPFSLKSKA